MWLNFYVLVVVAGKQIINRISVSSDFMQFRSSILPFSSLKTDWLFCDHALNIMQITLSYFLHQNW